MYVLDGDPVTPGDKLHHLEYGLGVVRSVEHGRVAADFGSGTVIEFGPGGTLGARKVLYWSPPLVIAPRKMDRPDQVAGYRAILEAVMAMVRGRNQ